MDATTKYEPQMGDVKPFIEALFKVKAERDALLAERYTLVVALRAVLDVIDANAHHDAVRLCVQQSGFIPAARAAIAKATGGGA